MPLTTHNITMPDRSRSRSTTTTLPISANQCDGGDNFDTGRANKRTTRDNYNLKLPKSIITTGKWNVRILKRFYKLEELTNELKRYRYREIISLAETSMTGTGELATDDGHKVYYSGQDRHFEGVRLLVRKDLTDSVINYSTIFSSIISIRVKAKPINITINQVYTPTTNYSDNEIKDFYETIEKVIHDSPRNYFIIIQGDLNANIGRNAQANGCVGRFGIGDVNDLGQRLLEFVERHKLVVANTLHTHKIKELQHDTHQMV